MKAEKVSYTKPKKDLSGEVKLILTKDLMNRYNILHGAKCFIKDELEKDLVFQPVSNNSQMFTGTEKIFIWISKWRSEQNSKIAVVSGNILPPKLIFSCNKRIGAKSFNHRNVVNLFIVYELDTWSRDINTDLNLSDCLFGSVKLAKNPGLDTYGYNGYSTGYIVHKCQMVNRIKILLFLEFIIVLRSWYNNRRG